MHCCIISIMRFPGFFEGGGGVRGGYMVYAHRGGILWTWFVRQLGNEAFLSLVLVLHLHMRHSSEHVFLSSGIGLSARIPCSIPMVGGRS